jgi:bacterioferritin (cytochrome b1)
MGILEKIRTSLSPKTRMLERLAVVAGRYETLAQRLKRHAELCTYPNIKAGLEHLAEEEAGQANTLRRILADLGAWPRLAETPSHDGSSNWERVSADLALQTELFRELNTQVVEWDGVDPKVAAHLREFLDGEDRNAGMLRDFALKCDPQAFD